jgi:2,7-dihydroxy-5-methyl-1-naphthoate 7-O-methyltransferase
MNLWEMADLELPWSIRVVATLRIANHMDGGVSDINELATAAGCNSDVLRRVLEFLVGKGLFEAPSPGKFCLNEAARGLLEPALLIGLDLNGIGGRMAGAWGTLLSYVRTGVPAYEAAFGLPFWEDLEAHPDIAASFDALIGPQGHGEFEGNFEITGGWDTVRTVVDVGGGTGAMLAAILLLRPTLRGILVELPRTVERAAETFRAAGVEDRVTAQGQSFFDPLPSGADIYLLRKVLNNWADREAVAILSRCAEAARPTGRVVILKSVGPETVQQGIPISALMVGGNDRSIAEFRALAAQSGLEVVAAGQQPSGYFVVECRTTEK